MLCLYIRRPELACFIAREKNHAPGFLRITFKHNALPPDASGREGVRLIDLTEILARYCLLASEPRFIIYYAIKRVQTQAPNDW
jgi:hypothetical protein